MVPPHRGILLRGLQSQRGGPNASLEGLGSSKQARRVSEEAAALGGPRIKLGEA